MKFTKLIFAICLGLIIFGCSKEKDEDTFQVYTRPGWTVESPEQYPNSFTAIVSIPENINAYAADNDIVAAFIDDECRGVGNLIISENGSWRVYIITVRGSSTENRNITFKYYSAQLEYLYQAKTMIAFVIDGTYGTIDNPIILDLENI